LGTVLAKESLPYFQEPYETKQRFCSYWHQIDEIRKLLPHHTLEIGVGTGFVSGYLKKQGLNLTTLDCLQTLEPDVAGSVLDVPFAAETFDVVSCCQVLEHLPYADFLPALKELARISKSYVVLSLPDKTTVYRIDLELPRLQPIRRLIHHPRHRPDRQQFDGEHYWEIGKMGYPLKRIESDIRIATLQIIKSYRVFEFPYHRFFILSA
jgi:ubiquinone/menaquinone biosynthesis C-methylase UbiE